MVLNLLGVRSPRPISWSARRSGSACSNPACTPRWRGSRSALAMPLTRREGHSRSSRSSMRCSRGSTFASCRSSGLPTPACRLRAELRRSRRRCRSASPPASSSASRSGCSARPGCHRLGLAAMPEGATGCSSLASRSCRHRLHHEPVYRRPGLRPRGGPGAGPARRSRGFAAVRPRRRADVLGDRAIAWDFTFLTRRRPAKRRRSRGGANAPHPS